MRNRLLCAVLGALACGWAQVVQAEDCHVGVYRLADGGLVDVAGEGKGLRWRTLDGRTGGLAPAPAGGWTGTFGFTGDPDTTAVGFGDCAEDRIRFGGLEGRRQRLAPMDAWFVSRGVRLRGRLVMPPGGGSVAVMVLGHGSERSSAVDTAFRQRLYPAAGVGVFVYDKRGTGASQGRYTQDFSVLADDAAAAMLQARRLAGARAGRVGFQGGSEAGWVLPLAASRTRADFVIIGYGIAASPIEEDRTETLQDLTAAGWGPEVLAKAEAVIAAADELIRSNFSRGYERLAEVRASYGAEPWFKDLKGEFTGEIAHHSEAELKLIGPAQDVGAPWDYDAVAALRRLKAPLLWMVAEADTEGAGPETPRALFGLQREGRPITVAVFPNTEHGLHLFLARGGRREHLGYPAGYFRMELDFARSGRLAGPYAGAETFRPRP